MQDIAVSTLQWRRLHRNCYAANCIFSTDPYMWNGMFFPFTMETALKWNLGFNIIMIFWINGSISSHDSIAGDIAFFTFTKLLWPRLCHLIITLLWQRFLLSPSYCDVACIIIWSHCCDIAFFTFTKQLWCHLYHHVITLLWQRFLLSPKLLWRCLLHERQLIKSSEESSVTTCPYIFILD